MRERGTNAGGEAVDNFFYPHSPRYVEGQGRGEKDKKKARGRGKRGKRGDVFFGKPQKGKERRKEKRVRNHLRRTS